MSTLPKISPKRQQMVGKTHLSKLWLNALLILALAAVTAAIYHRGLGGGFIFDDYPNIVDNPRVQPPDWSLKSLVSAAMSSPSSELKRPLASLTFAANYLASGLNAANMKATNVAIHILNGVLTFVLCTSLIRSVRRSDSDLGVALVSGAVTFAWLTAPINLTSVLYIVQRMESLANIFVLIGLLGYIKLRSKGEFSLARAWIAAIWLSACTLLGLLSKETAVLLPLYAFAVELCLFKFSHRGSPERFHLVGMYVALLAVPLLIGAAWLIPSILNDSAWMTRDFTLGTRLLSEPRAIVDYVIWILFPSESGLSFYHDDFTVSSSLFSPWTTLPSIVIILSSALLAWAFRSKLPLASFGILIFLSCQTLTGTIIPLELVYEHRSYFGSFGVILAAVEIIRYSIGQLHSTVLRKLATTLASCLLIWPVVLTITTVKAWDNPLTLAQELGRRAPGSPRAQYELGRAYVIASHYRSESPYILKAVAPLERAAAIPASSILPEQALIFLYSRSGLQVQDKWWASLKAKLAGRPATVQDESALGALADCSGQGLCRLDNSELDNAFNIAIKHAGASARLYAMYSEFAYRSLHNATSSLEMSKIAVSRSPNEPAYRIILAHRASASGDVLLAEQQLISLKAMNYAGRLSADISKIEQSLPKNSPPDKR